MGAKRARYDVLQYADRGVHRLRPREIEVLRLTAERAGAPLPQAALNFLHSDQEAVGIGDDNQLWVLEPVGVVKYPPARALDASRHAWRVSKALALPASWEPWMTDTMHKRERARRGLPDPWALTFPPTEAQLR